MPFLPTRPTSPALLRWHIKLAAFAIAACALLVACNPSLNWREVRSAEGSLLALFPCKVDVSRRNVALGGQEVEMALQSCKAADALFVVGQAAVSEAGAQVAVNHWQRAALTTISAPLANQAVKESLLPVAGVASTPTLLTAQGKRADGSGVQFIGVWFTRGSQVFHAAIYGDRIDAEMSEPFFSGLRLR